MTALRRLDEFEARLDEYSARRRKGLSGQAPSLYRVRPAIARIADCCPGRADANVLGRFYVKQVDVS